MQAIDTDRKTVTVNNGEMVNYDTLVIASGAIPRKLSDTLGVRSIFANPTPYLAFLGLCLVRLMSL